MIYEKFSSLIDYPQNEILSQTEEMINMLADKFPAAQTLVSDFIYGLKKKDLSFNQLQEHFTHVFYVTPQCIPYATIQIFGAQGHKRAEFMAKVVQISQQLKFDIGQELPDHLTVLLRFISVISKEEKREMIHSILLPSLSKMIEELDKVDGPYKYLYKAIEKTLEIDLRAEDKQC
ncbi:MAG: molecular chaperone TorD family protein [Pseudomonadota bacterium]